MSISSTSSTSSLQARLALQAQQAARSGPPGGGRGGGVIDDAAKALGLSTDDVISQLKDGKSLGDLADEQGVSRDDLAAALKAGAPPGMAAAENVDKVIGLMIDQVGGPQGPRPGPPPGGMSGLGSIDDSTSGVLGTTLTDDQQSMLDQLSSLLGTDSSSLLDDLKSGSSLSDLLSAQGIDQTKLASILQDGLLFDSKA